MPDRSRPIRLGVSQCLLGEAVRHDGGHKRNAFVADVLPDFVQFVPFCPELGAGLGVPREPVRLEQTENGVRMKGVRGGADRTDALNAFAAETVEKLEGWGLSGFILKKDSPSCGAFRVRLYDRNGIPSRNGTGLFAKSLMEAFPELPLEEEGRLNDAALRENFVERVFAYHRMTGFFASDWSPGDLVAFHTREKLLLMAHDPEAYKALGRLVAEAKGQDRDSFHRDYRRAFLTAMAKPVSIGRHVNVLQHMAGYFGNQLDVEDKAEIGQLIADYQSGLTPLLVPLTLIGHYVRRFGVEYLKDQTYLSPHPKELMLRNRV